MLRKPDFRVNSCSDGDSLACGLCCGAGREGEQQDHPGLGTPGMCLAHTWLRERPDRGFAQAELFMLGLMEPCWSSAEQCN